MNKVQKSDIIEAINQVSDNESKSSPEFSEATGIVVENLLNAIKVCDRNIIATLNNLRYVCDVCDEKCLISILDTLYEQGLIDFKTVDTLTKVVEDIQKLLYICEIKNKKDTLYDINFPETKEILRDIIESNYDC